MSPSGLDRIARGLASGEISRRSALKRLAGAGLGLGAVVAPAGVAEAMGGGCPPGRKKCGNKCCPKNAKCQNGKCKCKPGFKKCGKKCVDTDTSIKHCGDCNRPCDKGPDDICVDGGCTTGQACGDGAITGAEVCDGDDLGGESCVSQGFIGGTLACSDDCLSYDTSGCIPAECFNPDDCPDPASLCEQATCDGNICGSGPKPGIGGGCLCTPEEQGVIVCDEGTGNLTCDCPRIG